MPKSLPTDVISHVVEDVPVRTPQRGQKRDLLEMAGKNAQVVLEEKFRLLELDESKTTGAMKELTDAMGIAPGHKIEAFDHSHIQGADLVSAMVVFVDGQPNKNLYRKYKLKTVDHADEAASTKEVIRRRYTRLLKEHAEMPDLILMDGGVIQMNAVKDVLVNELGLDIPVGGMVKIPITKPLICFMAITIRRCNWIRRVRDFICFSGFKTRSIDSPSLITTRCTLKTH